MSHAIPVGDGAAFGLGKLQCVFEFHDRVMTALWNCLLYSMSGFGSCACYWYRVYWLLSVCTYC